MIILFQIASMDPEADVVGKVADFGLAQQVQNKHHFYYLLLLQQIEYHYLLIIIIIIVTIYLF